MQGGRLLVWLLGAPAWVVAMLGAGGLAACGAADCSAEKVLPGRVFPIGRVSGHVRLLAGELLPEYPDELLAREPLRPRVSPEGLPAECAAANVASRTPVSVAEGRGLSGVVVTASDFRRNRPRDPVVQRVRIAGCKLQPQTIAMMSGDRLVLENQDDYPFAPLYGPAYSATPLPRGQRLFIPTFPASIEPLSCSLDAPCGRTDVVVLQHPVHTVTRELGAFEIEGFPAGELVRLTAMHPLFEESETMIWVEPGDHLRVELSLKPKKRFVRPPPESP